MFEHYSRKLYFTLESTVGLFLTRELETNFLNNGEVFLPISVKSNTFKSLEIVTKRDSKVLDNSLRNCRNHK